MTLRVAFQLRPNFVADAFSWGLINGICVKNLQRRMPCQQ